MIYACNDHFTFHIVLPLDMSINTRLLNYLFGGGGVKIPATQITHPLSWNDASIVMVEIPSIVYG